MSGDDGILRPDFGSSSNSISFAKRGSKFCRHSRLLVDEQMRTVKCADEECGAVVDPFSVIVQYAKTERNFSHSKAQVVALRKETAELKAEEGRVKQRLARTKKGPQ